MSQSYDGEEDDDEDPPIDPEQADECHFERRLTVQSTGEVKMLYFLGLQTKSSRSTMAGFRWQTVWFCAFVHPTGRRFSEKSGGRQELLLPVVFTVGKAEIVEEIVW